MRLTKFGHACVRIEAADRVIVVDPGVISEPEAVDGATAILITHEHPDHWTAQALSRSDAPIVTIAAVADKIRAEAPEVAERIQVVAPGDDIDLGLPVSVVGEQHAVIYDQLPRVDNSGYLIRAGEQTIFHPGDALTVPDRPVDVLLLPVSAPWMKVSECIDFARAVGAPRSVAIHDGVYSEFGLGVVDGHLGRFLDGDYSRLASGTDLA